MVLSAARDVVQRCQRSGASLWDSTRRRKTLDNTPSQLARVLNLFDLTALSLGSTLGLGAYVLAGQASRDNAGPAVIISFAIGAIASLFAGLCYAEFAARVPKAGSAYVYAYVAIGELVAFVIGWTLILEYAIGTASVTRGVTSYIDDLVNHTISDYFTSTIPIEVSFLGTYPDFFAFFIIVVMTCLLAFGAKESSIFNSVLTILNLTTLSTAIVTGAIYAKPEYWFVKYEDIPAEYQATAGSGGFMPFGFKGVVSGAATCFFGFTGFDCIATTSEEAKKPRRDIPLAIIISLAIICTIYIAISVTLTMMWPYYAQDVNAPFAFAFDALGLTTIRWIVTVGAIFALTTSLLAVLFPLPRIVYAMAQDGLLFEFLSRVNNYTKTPLIATMVTGLLSAILATIFDLEQLIEMMSIGTLLAYTIVSYCVMILRYTDISNPDLSKKQKPINLKRVLGALVNWEKATEPTVLSTIAFGILLGSFTALALALCVLLNAEGDFIYTDPTPYTGLLLGLFVPMFIAVFLIYWQPQANVKNLSFTVPWLPMVPAVSIFLNLYLMAELREETWIRFVIWMAIGFAVYFLYSVGHSSERLAEVKRGDAAREIQVNGDVALTPLEAEESISNGNGINKNANGATHL